MKNIITTLLLTLTLSIFAQTNTEGINWNIKQGTESINFDMPEGTVINSSRKATIKGKSLIIDFIDKNQYLNERLKDSVAPVSDDINILIGFTTKDIKRPENYEDQNNRTIEYRKTDKGNVIVFWEDTYINEDAPKKLRAATIDGNSILTLTLENNSADFEDAKKMLITILNSKTQAPETKIIQSKI